MIHHIKKPNPTKTHILFTSAIDKQNFLMGIGMQNKPQSKQKNQDSAQGTKQIVRSGRGVPTDPERRSREHVKSSKMYLTEGIYNITIYNKKMHKAKDRVQIKYQISEVQIK